MKNIILSLFQGIGMLDSGFVRKGYCVVSGPERILGNDISDFTGQNGAFEGIIGGSPCVDYSGLNRNPSNYSDRMKAHFERIVEESQPDWFLLENVLRVPDVHLEGYYVQRFNLSPRDLGYQQSRPRCFQFGSKKGLILELPEPVKNTLPFESCLTASQGGNKRRGFDEFCKLQGFDIPPELESFTLSAKYRAVGNGVHLGVSHTIADLIVKATTKQNPKTIFNSKLCLCGCGRIPYGNKKYFSGACRNRAFTKRLRSVINAPGNETFQSCVV